MGSMTEEDKKPDENKQEKNDMQTSVSISSSVSEQIIPPVVHSEKEEEETISQIITEAELPEFKSEIGRKLFGPEITSKQAPPTPEVPKELRKLSLKIELKSEQNGFAKLSVNDARKITDKDTGLIIVESTTSEISRASKFKIDEQQKDGHIQIGEEIYKSLNCNDERLFIRFYSGDPIRVDNVTLAVSPISGNDIFHTVGTLRKSIAKLKKFLESYTVFEGLTVKWKERNALIKVAKISPALYENDVGIFDFTKPRVLTIKPDGAMQFNTILIMDISKSMNGRDLEVKNVKSAIERIKAAFSYEELDEFLKVFKEGNNVQRKSGAIFAGLLYLSEKARIGIGETVSLIMFADSAEVIRIENKPYVITDSRSKGALNSIAEQVLVDLEEKMGAGTNMASAIEASGVIMKNLPRSKRKWPLMVILLTDGFDTSKRVREAVSNTYSKKGNVVLHAVGLGPFVNKQELIEISDLCGGELFQPDDLGELLQWYTDRAKDLSIKLAETEAN
ncbi:MAG: VWA domain-containing protein [Asgard group archaeon]|nr:VWA domain-containing protein [Asgard group archaeon]